jgi:hypothetical protein
LVVACPGSGLVETPPGGPGESVGSGVDGLDGEGDEQTLICWVVEGCAVASVLGL